MAETPYAFMKDEDRARFQAALTAALDDAADGETREWSNADTRAGGKLTLVRTLGGSADRCREVRIANKAGGRAETNNIIFCRGDGGKWRPRAGP
jgi:surface antigen